MIKVYSFLLLLLTIFALQSSESERKVSAAAAAVAAAQAAAPASAAVPPTISFGPPGGLPLVTAKRTILKIDKNFEWKRDDIKRIERGFSLKFGQGGGKRKEVTLTLPDLYNGYEFYLDDPSLLTIYFKNGSDDPRYYTRFLALNAHTNNENVIKSYRNIEYIPLKP